jgi:hypothetical protein
MSLNTITSAAAPQQTSSLQSNWQNVLDAAARTLGMSPGSVAAQLRAGSSLSSIAQSRGLSQEALTTSIAGALSPSTLSASTGAERRQIAASIADRVGGGHHYAGSSSAAGGNPLFAGLDGGAVSVSITSADVLVVLTAGAAAPSSGSTVDQLA